MQMPINQQRKQKPLSRFSDKKAFHEREISPSHQGRENVLEKQKKNNSANFRTNVCFTKRVSNPEPREAENLFLNLVH